MAIRERAWVPVLAKRVLTFLPRIIPAGIQMDANRLVVRRLIIQGPTQVGGDHLASQIDVLIGKSPVSVFGDVTIAVKQIDSCSSSGNLHRAEAGSAIRIGARACASR